MQALNELRRLGFEIEAVGERVRVRYHSEVPPDEAAPMLEELRRRKPEVLEKLRGQTSDGKENPSSIPWQAIPASAWNDVLWDLEAFQKGAYIVTAAAEPPDFPIVLCSNASTVEKAQKAGLIPGNAVVFTGAEYAMLLSISDRLRVEDVRQICHFKRELQARLVRVSDLKISRE